jgi:hypothetical protein
MKVDSWQRNALLLRLFALGGSDATCQQDRQRREADSRRAAMSFVIIQGQRQLTL